MKLSDFKKPGRGAHARYVERVADTGSREEHELTIAGPDRLVREMFAESEFELTVDAQRTQDQLLADVDATLAQQRRDMWDLAALQSVGELLKPDDREPPRAETTVFASVRPVSGQGTPFALVASSFFVPTGARVFFFGSLVFTTVGSVLPATGDQDLFLHFFTPTGPVVSSSRGGGLSLDVAWFTVPLFPWVPVFEVRGFTAGVCSVFTAHGA